MISLVMHNERKNIYKKKNYRGNEKKSLKKKKAKRAI